MDRVQRLRPGDVVALSFGGGHRLGLVHQVGRSRHGLPAVAAYVYSSSSGSWSKGPRPVTRMELVAHLGTAMRYHKMSDGRRLGWADTTPDRDMASQWLPALRLAAPMAYWLGLFQDAGLTPS